MVENWQSETLGEVYLLSDTFFAPSWKYFQVELFPPILYFWSCVTKVLQVFCYHLPANWSHLSLVVEFRHCKTNFLGLLFLLSFPFDRLVTRNHWLNTKYKLKFLLSFLFTKEIRPGCSLLFSKRSTNKNFSWYLVFSHWFLVNDLFNGKDIYLEMYVKMWFSSS